MGVRVIVRYRNSPADLISFQIHCLPRLREIQILAVACVLLFSYITYAALRQTPASLFLKIVTFVTMLIILLTVVFAGTVLLSLIAWVPRFRREVATDYQLEVSPEGVIEQTAHGRREMLWAGVKRVQETRRSILIYVSEREAHVVPKRCFGSREEERAFYEFATIQHKARRAA
jgi:hypothetical protein